MAAGSELAVEGLDVVPREGGVPVLPGGERHELDQQTDVPRPAQPHTHAALRPLRRPVAQPPAEARAQLVLAACQVQPQGAGGRDPGLGRPKAADEQRATDVVPVVRGLHEERAAGAGDGGQGVRDRRDDRRTGRRPLGDDRPRGHVRERHADREPPQQHLRAAGQPVAVPHEDVRRAVPHDGADARPGRELVDVGPRRPGDEGVPRAQRRLGRTGHDLGGDHVPGAGHERSAASPPPAHHASVSRTRPACHGRSRTGGGPR